MNEKLISREIVENRLLVEGSDDVHVCFHLLKYYHLHEQITIVDKQGYAIPHCQDKNRPILRMNSAIQQMDVHHER